MAAFEQTPVSYLVGGGIFICGLLYIAYSFINQPPDLHMIQFSCRPSPGTPDAYANGTLRNISEDEVEVYIEIELYLDRQEVKVITAEVSGGNTIAPNAYVRFDAIARDLGNRTKNCGIRFSDSRGNPVLVVDKTARTSTSDVRQ